jgi:hypothetical protein
VNRFNNNPIFRFLDKIPLIRRSGTASPLDLFKAMAFTLTFTIILQAFLFGMTLAQLAIILIVCAPIVLLALFLHPFLSHRRRDR